MLNARYGVWNLYRSQAAAAREGIPIDIGDGVGNHHRSQAAAPLEGSDADRGDGVGNDCVFATTQQSVSSGFN